MDRHVREIDCKFLLMSDRFFEAVLGLRKPPPVLEKVGLLLENMGKVFAVTCPPRVGPAEMRGLV